MLGEPCGGASSRTAARARRRPLGVRHPAIRRARVLGARPGAPSAVRGLRGRRRGRRGVRPLVDGFDTLLARRRWEVLCSRGQRRDRLRSVRTATTRARPRRNLQEAGSLQRLWGRPPNERGGGGVGCRRDDRPAWKSDDGPPNGASAWLLGRPRLGRRLSLRPHRGGRHHLLVGESPARDDASLQRSLHQRRRASPDRVWNRRRRRRALLGPGGELEREDVRAAAWGVRSGLRRPSAHLCASDRRVSLLLGGRSTGPGHRRAAVAALSQLIATVGTAREGTVRSVPAPRCRAGTLPAPFRASSPDTPLFDGPRAESPRRHGWLGCGGGRRWSISAAHAAGSGTRHATASSPPPTT